MSSLSRAQAGEVLRYWLASLQLEEALATRPRARRAAHGSLEPHVQAPNPGQDYFKLPLDGGLEALLASETTLRRPFDAELGAFFEAWLFDQYRRGADDRELSHLLAFPVLHLPRGELAGLLRYAVRVHFGQSGGPEFRVPTRSERRRNAYPRPPNELRLEAARRGARQWPFFLDTRLLQQQLGVPRESIDALFVELRAQAELDAPRMLGKICELLEREAGAPATGADTAPLRQLLERISAACVRLLAARQSRARAYPVGIVIDGARAKTTWHLQAELQQLLDEDPDVAQAPGSCLDVYLTGRAAVSGVKPQRALFTGPALSESQRAAAECAWGSRFSAVQGPPGTGKSTLILHMAADALVRKVEQLLDDGTMGEGVLLVTSTNNRAVDNVIEPLNARQGGLPLGLRAGSQRVCEQLLSAQLGAARNWLVDAAKRPPQELDDALARARAEFECVRAAVRDAFGDYARACEARTQAAQLRHALAQLADEPDAPALSLDKSSIEALYAPLQKAERRLQQLCQLCEGSADLTQLNAISRAYRAAAKRDLPAFEEAARAAGLELDLGLPPLLPPSTDVCVLFETWEEAASAALAKLEALRERLARVLGQAQARQRRSALQSQLASLEAAEQLPSRPECDDLQRELFERALAVREAWAAAQSGELVPLLERAQAAARDGSLRPLWNEDRGALRELHRLFGIWGCTLLSLGNGFPARSELIEQIVIDEAGQCHPAYAVSALLRARAALCIGDVHQLEPVIDLDLSDDERVIEACKLGVSRAELAPYRVHGEARCSVQALADRAVQERPRLIDHFRCQPEIIAISDALCHYGLRVHTERQAPSVPLPFLPEPVSMIDAAGEQERLGGSWYNAVELTLTLELSEALLRAGLAPEELAIITPYRGQLEQLYKRLSRAGIALERSLELSELDQPQPSAAAGVALGTVHRFQGGERSVVIWSSVVTRRASLAFLDARENLLNVAVSRARHRFVAIGARSLLASGRRTSLLTRAAMPLVPEAFRTQLDLLSGL